MDFRTMSLGMSQNLPVAGQTAGTHHLSGSDGDRAVGGIERDGPETRGAVRVDKREFEACRGLVGRQPEPLAVPFPVTRDLQAADGDVGGGPDRGVNALVLPLDVVGQLRVRDESLDPKLTPSEQDAVGTVPAAGHGLTAKSLLGLGEVVDADNPPQPATAGFGTGPDSLTEGRLVGGGVVKHRNHLDVTLLGQRKDDVARSEARMDTAIDRRYPELLGEALRCSRQPVGFGSIRNVVNSHTVIVTLRCWGALTGGPFRWPFNALSATAGQPASLLVKALRRSRTAS